MKTYIKYFLLVICIIILAGCNNQSDDGTPLETTTETPFATPTFSPTSAPTPEPAITAVPDIPTFILVRNKTFMSNEAKDYVTDWQLLLQYKFGIRVIVHDILSYGEKWSYTTGDTNLIAESGTNVFAEIKDYRENAVISAFNDSLVNSKSWNELPDRFKDSYTDSNGNIWAIPRSDNASVFARAYNREWLDALNLSVPTGINDLYEVLTAFAVNDPDNNGERDTFGTAIVPRSTSMHTFKDVFEANGCRLTYSYSSQFRNNQNTIEYKSVPVGYNPDSKRIEDYSTSEGMRLSLDLIKGLIDTDTVSITSNSMAGGRFLKGEFGSQMGLLEENLMNTDLYYYTFSLNEAGDEKVTSVPRAGNDAYFLYSRTPDKDEIVPAFIDTFYGTKEGYKTAYAGLTGKYFKFDEDDNGLIMNEDSNVGKTHIDLLGNLSWFDLNIRRPDISKGMSVVNVTDLMNDPRMFILEPRHMSFMENFTAGPADGSGGSDKYEKEMNSAFSEFYKGLVSTDDLLEQIKHINIKYDIPSLIEQTNERWLLGN